MRKILLEDRRSALLSKSKSGADYAPGNRQDGKNRYQRRLKSKIASSTKNFNSINMNKVFKDDILDVIIDVTGETDIYPVRISFAGMLEELYKLIDAKKDPEASVDRRDIARALTKAFNNNDVYINCSCPDFKYRFKYWCTVKGTLVGDPEYRPINPKNHAPTEKALRAANYYNDRGSGCKHVNLVLNDASWLIKVASVIYNYINYMKDNNSRLYEKFIYPAIYRMPYPEEQLDIFDITDENPRYELLPGDEKTLDTANIEAEKRGQFKPGNEYRAKKVKPDPNQFTLDDYGADEEETEEIT